MKQRINKINLIAIVVILLLGMVASLVSAATQVAYAANSAAFTISPQSGTFQTGSNLSFNIYINLASPYNAAFADVYFNSSKFQYQGATIGPSFNGGGNATIRSNGYGSYVTLSGSRNTGGSLQNKQLLATVRFKAQATGSTYLNFGSRRVVLYPTTEYTTTATNGTYTISSPPAPTPTPTPTPTPQPPAPTPTPTRRPTPAPRVPASSAAPAGRLQVNNLTVTNISYASADLTWQTNTPSNSKVNFGTDKSDLYLEQLDDTPTTNHTINLDSTNLSAGTTYFFRITSDDGRGPVTIDGEFTTKFIPVIVRVTDTNDDPIADAEITVDDLTGSTNEDGEATFDLKQGEITIYATKGSLESEFTAEIEIPEESEPPQKISVVLSESSDSQSSTAAVSSESGGSAVVRIILALFVLLCGGGLLFYILWRRRQVDTTGESYSPEPDQTYNQPTPPPLPPLTSTEKPMQAPLPTLTTSPSTGPEHHATLPELVGRYGVQHESSTKTSTVDPAKPSIPVSPSGIPIPKHTSLKDLVQLPEQQPTGGSNSDINGADPDLPIGPTTSNSKHKDDPEDDSLVIHH